MHSTHAHTDSYQPIRSLGSAFSPSHRRGHTPNIYISECPRYPHTLYVCGLYIHTTNTCAQQTGPKQQTTMHMHHVQMLSPGHTNTDSHTDAALTHTLTPHHTLSQYPCDAVFSVRTRALCTTQAQNAPYEQPMDPITMMRNALGMSEGGSGVPLNREQYDASVKFWSEHVNVR